MKGVLLVGTSSLNEPEIRNPNLNAETQRTQRGKAATELIDVRGHAEHSEDGGSRMEDGGD